MPFSRSELAQQTPVARVAEQVGRAKVMTGYWAVCGAGDGSEGREQGFCVRVLDARAVAVNPLRSY
jgi:hypothetical protein